MVLNKIKYEIMKYFPKKKVKKGKNEIKRNDKKKAENVYSY